MKAPNVPGTSEPPDPECAVEATSPGAGGAEDTLVPGDARRTGERQAETNRQNDPPA